VQDGSGGSGPEFHVNFGSVRVESLHLWVGLGRVMKLDPRPTLNQPMTSRHTPLTV